MRNTNEMEIRFDGRSANEGRSSTGMRTRYIR